MPITQAQIEVVQQQLAQIIQTVQKAQRIAGNASNATRIRYKVGAEIKALPDDYAVSLIEQYQETKALLKAQVDALP